MYCTGLLQEYCINRLTKISAFDREGSGLTCSPPEQTKLSCLRDRHCSAGYFICPPT